MSLSPLQSTERRLITLFVWWAFLFLLIFEGIFLAGRIILENQFQKDDFERSASHVINRINTRPQGNLQTKGKKPPIDLGYIMIDASGKIVENHIGGGLEQYEIDEMLDMSTIAALPLGQTTSYSGIYIQRIINPHDPSLQILMIKNGGYNFDDILRDILRFLALDLIILVPFWFLWRVFVREILEPVEKNIEAMSHFVHDAGHELKTPLAIISGNLQILRDMKGKDTELISGSISTVSALAASLDGLVELSNLGLPTKRESIDLLISIEEIVKLYSHESQQKHIKVSLDIPRNIKIRVESAHLSILFGNLLKNAITYTTEWWSIQIAYKDKILSIEDSGIGMKQEDVEKIFDRFFRVDRSGAYAGSGIGLALVDRIVKLYGWSIRVESTLGTGTRFILRIK